MKKLLWAFVGIFVICVAGFGVAYWKLNSIAKFAIEEVGSAALKTKVEVSSVSLMPFSGKGAIYGFKIRNPEGYSSPYAFAVGKVAVHVNLSALRKNILEVSKVEVSDPTIWYEGLKEKNNFTKLQANAQRSATASAKPEHAPTAANKKSSRSDMAVALKEFFMHKSTVHLVKVLPFVPEKTIELSDIHFSNDGKMSQADMIAKISGMIAGNVATVGMRSIASPDMIKKQVLDKVKLPKNVPGLDTKAFKKLF